MYGDPFGSEFHAVQRSFPDVGHIASARIADGGNFVYVDTESRHCNGMNKIPAAFPPVRPAVLKDKNSYSCAKILKKVLFLAGQRDMRCFTEFI
jgi:hypothetical protein